MIDTGGLMSEAAKLPEAQQSKAMREISSVELPTVHFCTCLPPLDCLLTGTKQ